MVCAVCATEHPGPKMEQQNLNSTSQPAAAARPRAVRLPNFQMPPSQGFFSRLHEFLTERPVKLPRSTAPAVFSRWGYSGGGFFENLKEYFRPMPPGARTVRSRMIVDQKPFYLVLWEDLHDAIAPPRLPPLKITSQPIKVKDIWTKDTLAPRTATLSLAVHVLCALLISFPVVWRITSAAEVPQVHAAVNVIDISPYIAKLPPGGKKAGGGGGGGERSPEPASKGKAPKFAMEQFAKPLVVPRNLNPKLAMDPNLLGPPELKIPSPNLPNYGDPLAAVLTSSSGPGSGAGIGTGSGGGIGPGEGGGTGGGVFQAGRNGVGEPTCLYCPSPVFSTEAVKAKYQGPVTLRLIVTADGRATNIQVVQSPGLGLDEKAVEAVRNWKFRPAIGPSGKPVATYVLVEVSFRLL